MKIFIFILVAVFIISPGGFGQSTMDREESNKSFSIHLIKGYQISEQSFTTTHATSNFGIEAQLTFHKGEAWGVQLKSSWLKWPDGGETYVPVLIGPEFGIPLSGSMVLSIYGNAGPTLLIGNDFGSVFGNVEAGLQLSSGVKRGLVIGLSWNQNLIFHPSYFSFVKGALGWRF